MEPWERFNFVQYDIDKFERRRKRAIENPDPARLKSNALLYEMWRDLRQSQLDAWKRGEPFVYTNSPMYGIFDAMDLRHIALAYFTNTMGRDVVMRYFNAARDMDFPSESCDWTQLSVGVALKDELPRPSAIFWSYNACGPVGQQSAWMATHFNVPAFPIDIPPDPTERGIRYVVAQLEDTIEKCEKMFPGHKYDEAKHQKLLDMIYEVQQIIDELMVLKSGVPSPLPARDALRMSPTELADDPRVMEYYKMLRAEIKERIEQRVLSGELPEEKARLFWLVLVPSITDPYGALERNGIASPLTEIGFGIVQGYRVGPEVEKKFGRKLRPLEQEAVRALLSDWGGPAERRWEPIKRWCKEYKIDGLIHPNMPGCATCVGSARIIAEKARDELGIPTLMLDGWIQDFEKLDEDEFKSQIEQFGEMIGASKKKAR